MDPLWQVLYIGLIIFIVLMILFENRNPVKTMAWVLCVCFLPILGIVLYLFFGQNLRRMRLISRRARKRLKRRPLQAYRRDSSPQSLTKIADYAMRASGALVFNNNQVEVFYDGYDFLRSLVLEIKKAKHHIHLQFYIWDDDAVGRLIRDLLIDKAKEGVVVRAIYDDVGSWHTGTCFFNEMKKNGIEVRPFMQVVFPLLTRKVNYRNHRKIVVIDGKVGFVGGMNIATRYLRGNPRIGDGWRDTHLLIRGKATYGLQTSFLTDWHFVCKNAVNYTPTDYFPTIPDSPTEQAGIPIQIVTSDPMFEWKGILGGILMAIYNAKQYIYLQTPYFLPTEPLLNALQTAALAGVDVRLMIPHRSDSWLVALATNSYLKDVLRSGVKVYRYRAGFLHAKLLVSDDKFCTIGSSNLDFRSLEHNFEVNAFIYDPDFACQQRDVFLHDMQRCRRIILRGWMRRPFMNRFIEQIMRLFSPLL